MRRTSRNINISTKNKQHSRIAHVRSTEKKKLRLSKFQSFFFLFFISYELLSELIIRQLEQTSIGKKEEKKHSRDECFDRFKFIAML